jgi:hypothetical protein
MSIHVTYQANYGPHVSIAGAGPGRYTVLRGVMTPMRNVMLYPLDRDT